jgi:hypothetical protein
LLSSLPLSAAVEVEPDEFSAAVMFANNEQAIEPIRKTPAGS